MRSLLLALVYLSVSVFVFIPYSASAADLFIEPNISSQYSSNIYLNRQEEWDFGFYPRLASGLEFADFWTVGYQGRAELFTQHTDLLSHKHDFYLLANPVWGEEGENDFFARLSAKTQQNSDEYDSIDYLTPSLDFGLQLEPFSWFRWSLLQNIAYRWFYNDSTVSSFDSWTHGSVTLTAQTRTTFSPRVAYGFRYYTGTQGGAIRDTDDQQLEAGAHLSQGLWEQAGMQIDYAYIHAFEDSVFTSRNMSDTSNVEFSYIGNDFLYTGHRAQLGFKQIFQHGWRLGLSVQYETRTYGGWSTIDQETGMINQETDRFDKRLSPNIWVEYNWWPQENDGPSVPELKTSIEYFYLRQWSNDDEYDTSLHLATINLGLSWLL